MITSQIKRYLKWLDELSENKLTTKAALIGATVALIGIAAVTIVPQISELILANRADDSAESLEIVDVGVDLDTLEPMRAARIPYHPLGANTQTRQIRDWEVEVVHEPLGSSDEDDFEHSDTTRALRATAPKIVNEEHVSHPVIDIKLRNNGTQVAYLKGVTFNVLASKVDVTPDLRFSIIVDDESLRARVRNYGWGPAVDAQIENLTGEIRELLEVRPEVYRWSGVIEEEALLLQIEKDDFLERCKNSTLPSFFGRRQPLWPSDFSMQGVRSLSEFLAGFCSVFPNSHKGLARYYDTGGKKYTKEFTYLWETNGRTYDMVALILGDTGFHLVETGVRESVMPASAVYKIVLAAGLSIQKDGYSESYGLSHQIKPNEVERLQFVVGADKSAVFTVGIILHYNRNRHVKLNPLSVKVEKLREGIL